MRVDDQWILFTGELLLRFAVRRSPFAVRRSPFTDRIPLLRLQILSIVRGGAKEGYSSDEQLLDLCPPRFISSSLSTERRRPAGSRG